ncbi:hypothetical protein GCM10011316_15960 [Roseibium aquae]|uniref:Uncharacterized protein n=1 Tax=Roseibium aquae TaxID=1323746 RepID=A0A916TGR4_9HYPH|nr:hypothetical protein [Roseibium aquae]GGB44748.1 hypothetical protein GCM10011316_15960 [Roseibium aquae]
MALRPEDLDYALLSMDDYNRGDSPSMNVPNPPYTITDRSDPSDSQNYGFSATAYQVGGTAVIAFRGTDGEFPEFNFLTDVWNGWGVGAGSLEGKQAEGAVKWHQRVKGVAAAF